jgi:signal transduction histidine kinase
MARPLKTPGFFWQGLLIVLPALALAGMGFYSLRQDRILAEHEATGQGRQLASDLAQRWLPQAFRRDLPGIETVWSFLARPAQPGEDPVIRCAQAAPPRLLCLVDPSGSLRHPPPLRPFPTPRSFAWDSLPAARRAALAEAQEAIYGDQDWPAAIARLEPLADPPLPEPFQSLIAYQAGVARRFAGDLAGARRQFEGLLAQPAAVLNESGIPFKTLSAWHLLQLAGANHAPEGGPWQAVVGADALLHPTHWSAYLLEMLPAGGWQQGWQIHCQARQLHESYGRAMQERAAGEAPDFGPAWVNQPGGQPYFVCAEPQGTNRWLLGLPAKALAPLIGQVLAGVAHPAYLGWSVEAGGRSILAAPAKAPLLAMAATPRAAPRAEPEFRVGVYLARADLLYERHQARTRWFGLLIGLSMAAVLAGFFTAWRAFVRQQQLNLMKTNFVSAVSHELRAPIASVRLMAEELEELEELPPGGGGKPAEYHRFISQECRRLSALIENVLDFARHEQGRQQYEFEPTDLAALVTHTVQLMQNYAASKKITLASAVQGVPAPVEVDGRAVQQVLVNLLDNAIKHSPAGATVQTRLAFGPTRVSLSVEDTGEGIPPEDHQRIFERFYRRGSELRRETQGVGLGLAIVQYVVEAHHGTVGVRSAAGQGSCFTVELPLQQPGETH